jgi:putative photosynthetic complex assembly protein 2
MYLYADAALFALFVWWFSTGLIIFLDGLPRKTFKYSLAGATVATAGALYALHASAHNTTTSGAYIAFAAGVFAWGWQEISFYMGFVTGPRTAPCPEGCSGWNHFLHAIQTSLWHELAIIASASLVVGLTWHAPNQVGTWTFMVLWWMHQSAKLNVFLGVQNLNEEFLPEHLTFLRSFLTKKPMNLLFPFSVSISTVILVIMVQHAGVAGASVFHRSAATFIATMMALAILEHWFLVLPMPSQKLWDWGLASRTASKPFAVEIVAGFLGAGKTTYMRRLLAQNVALAAKSAKNLRTIVLVNDFASVGIDGSLLAGQGADVVELPNGCICCSLKADLSRQLKDVVARFAPDRVLIEPSGVADLASLLRVLNAPDLAPLVRQTNVTTILDGGAFLADFGRMAGHLQAQIVPAGRVVINKADLVSPATLRMIATTVIGIAPSAHVVPARFGLVDETSELLTEINEPVPVNVEHTVHAHHDHARDHDHAHSHTEGHQHDAHAEHHEHDDHAEHDAPHDTMGLTSWSTVLREACDADELQTVLEAVAQGRFGQVERMKGVARAGAGWVRFDVAGGRPSIAAFAAAKDESARVVAIGRDVDEEKLHAAFKACAAA